MKISSLSAPTKIEELTAGGAALCFFVWSGCQFFYLCRSWKRREFETGNSFNCQRKCTCTFAHCPISSKTGLTSTTITSVCVSTSCLCVTAMWTLETLVNICTRSPISSKTCLTSTTITSVCVSTSCLCVTAMWTIETLVNICTSSPISSKTCLTSTTITSVCVSTSCLCVTTMWTVQTFIYIWNTKPTGLRLFHILCCQATNGSGDRSTECSNWVEFFVTEMGCFCLMFRLAASSDT